MKVGLQFPVQELSGRDGLPGGLVYYMLQTLQCARRFVTPTNPDTSFQDAARSILTLCAQNFKNLTDAQRATFATYAAANPVQILGRDFTLQDMAQYISCDWWKYLNDASHLTTAPAAPADFTCSSINTVAYNSGTNDLSFNAVHNGTATVGYWAVFSSPTLASAQRNARRNDFRLAHTTIASAVIDVAATPQTITMDDSRFSWSNGDYMEILLIPISDDYGPGSPVQFKQTITVT